MSAATRLGAYGAGLVLAFGASFLAADVLVPEHTVDRWKATAEEHGTDADEHGTDPEADARSSGSTDQHSTGHLLQPQRRTR